MKYTFHFLFPLAALALLPSCTNTANTANTARTTTTRAADGSTTTVTEAPAMNPKDAAFQENCRALLNTQF